MDQETISKMSEEEKTILGHLIRFPERAAELVEGIEGSDFESAKHKAIFEAIVDHMGEGFDNLTLSNALKGQGWEINPSDLLAFGEYAFDGVDTTQCKERIKLESQKRDLSSFLTSKVKDLKAAASDIEEIRESLLEKLSALPGESFGGKLIKTPSDFSTELQDISENKRPLLYSGLKDLDDLIGGFRRDEMSIITGETSSGKTTLASAHLPYRISQAGHPVLIASFEMKPPAILKKMVQMTKGRPFNELTPGEIQDGLDFVSELPLFFIDVYGELGLRELKGCLFYARRKFGIEFAVLDHLHYFLKFNADQERQAIDSALRNIKTWAMQLGIHILLVVHPTKLTYDNAVVHLNDLKGSSGLKQVPDNVFSIWRPRGEDDLKKPENQIILYVLKVRDDAGDEGKVILTFDKRSQSYSDSGPDLARSAQGERSPASSPSSRTLQGRDWLSGYDS